ncbi:MAG: hypothetical protein IID35_07680 [Planctomycetes bacterium]|nr:hypothetical protein [Planctomycetota bacterium]
MSQPVRSKLFEETVSVTWPLSEIDLDALRRGFAPPFDRAAHAVQLAGFEQDDAVIERYLCCRVGDRPPVDVPADSMSDRSRMIEDVVTALRHVGHVGGRGDATDGYGWTTRPTPADAQTDSQVDRQAGVQADDVTIVGLRVVAIRESWSTSMSPLAKGGPQGRQ